MALLRKFWMELRSLIVLGAAYYLFRDANFTVFQSLLLACLATFTLSWIFVSNKHARRYKFEPFRFAFRINWYDLLRDYKIVDEEGWKRLCEKAQSQPKEEHRFLTASQTTFTRIGPTLTYIDEVRKFTSRIDWNQFLEEIEAGDEQQRRYGWHPRFYVKESSDKHP
ncbi:MAG: hypothetical protein JO097_03695, partial [Acidobacteriaceae bacterium]|nr:hypothetical protein [Acidobacteriaceae bacterium]